MQKLLKNVKIPPTLNVFFSIYIRNNAYFLLGTATYRYILSCNIPATKAIILLNEKFDGCVACSLLSWTTSAPGAHFSIQQCVHFHGESHRKALGVSNCSSTYQTHPLVLFMVQLGNIHHKDSIAGHSRQILDGLMSRSSKIRRTRSAEYFSGDVSKTGCRGFPSMQLWC